MSLTNTEIIEQTLIKLDGWVLSDPIIEESVTDINEGSDDSENESVNIDDTVEIDEFLTETEIDDLEYNKKISREEILSFYNDATEYSKSYLQRPDTWKIPVYDTAIIFWTAGLIWEKYNQKENSQLDDTNPNPWGYGDKLIIQAKEMLKPFKAGFVFHAY